MKKRLFLFALLVPAGLYAQPSVEDAKGPVRLSDAVHAYQQHEKAPAFVEDEEDARDGSAVHEGKDYHFDRWLWYWKQHTDQDGYMVSPLRTAKEWKAYREKQGQNKTTASVLADWKFTGPQTTISGYAGIGRINAMAFHPADLNTLWVGSAGGGVWKTTDNGANWTCLTDMLPVLSVSDIDVNQQNPNTLYLCTGDRDSRDHYSIGVLKSTDGGNSWDTTGLKWPASSLRLTNTLEINRLDTNSLVLAASDGIYKSFDGGKNWTNVKPGNFKQVLYHPTDTNIVYATSFYTATSGVPAQVFRSGDGGMNWTQVTNLSQSWRITLAVSPADVRYVKAVVSTYDVNKWRGLLGVYSSSDTGKTFTQVFNDAGCTKNILNNNPSGNGCTGQGNYDLAIAMSPANANVMYIGGVNTWTSANGGSSWTVVNQWTGFLPGIAVVHADKHFLGFHPLKPQRLFECNDGGVYWTESPASQLWNDISDGLGITQFYRNAVADAASYVLGGAQDNGTKSYDGSLWDDATGGDGMDCQIDPVDPNTFYTGVQYGKIYRVDGFATDISANIPTQPTGAWITPYIISPFDNYQLLAGYQHIFWSGDKGDSWSPVTTFPLVSFNKNILRLAMTPASQSTIYAIPDSSNSVYYTHGFTPGSTATFSSLIPPYSGQITDIKVDAKDKDHFWITYGGFGSPQVAEYSSGIWKQLNINLPDVPVLCFEADSANGILYVGTDVGVFFLDTVNKQWMPYNTNLPAVHVTDLGINYTTGEIWAATYGRGMWHSPKQEYNNGVSTIPFAPDAIIVYPNPSKGQFTVVSKVKGYRGAVSFRMIDNMGRTVWQGAGSIDGEGKAQVNVETVARGTYTFEVSGKGMVIGRRRMAVF